jgi:hypothetical protein
MIIAAVTRSLAGVLTGYVLQRGSCASTQSSATHWTAGLLHGWVLGVALASAGLALLFLLPGTSGLNQGLAFRTVANVAGGLIIGIGMVVATSCVSGPTVLTVLTCGEGATIPCLLGMPRLTVAIIVLAAVAVAIWRLVANPRPGPLPPTGGRWSAPGRRRLDRRGLQPRPRALGCRPTQRLVVRRREAMVGSGLRVSVQAESPSGHPAREPSESATRAKTRSVPLDRPSATVDRCTA